MGDIQTFYKTLQVGDFTNGPQRVRLEGPQVEMKPVTWAKSAVPHVQGPGVFFEIGASISFRRGHVTPSEDDWDFASRKMQFLAALRDTLAPSATNAYEINGWLVQVRDDASEVTTTTLAVSQGSSVQVTLTNGFADMVVGNYVYLADANNHAVVEATVVGVGGETFRADLPSNFDAGATAALVHVAWPNAYLLQGPEFRGREPGTFEAETDVELSWQTVDEPVIRA